MTTNAMGRTVVDWNRSRLDLRSDEVLAQILNRGELTAWRELYRLAADDADLRRRIWRCSGALRCRTRRSGLRRWPAWER